MKIKEGFLIREIAGLWMVVPLGQRVVEFNGLMMLSESSVMLWRLLETGAEKEDLMQLLLSEYEIDAETAKTDIEEFLGDLRKIGLLDNL